MIPLNFYAQQNLPGSLMTLVSLTMSLAMFALSVLLTSRNLLGSPIHCSLVDSYSQNYIDSYCWATPTTTSFPPQYRPNILKFPPNQFKETYLDYNPAVLSFGFPFFLFILAVVYMLPYLYWRSADSGRFAYYSRAVRESITKFTDYDKRIEQLAKFFQRGAQSSRMYFRSHLYSSVLMAAIPFLVTLSVNYFYGHYPFVEVDYEQYYPLRFGCVLDSYGPSGTLQVQSSLCILPYNSLYPSVIKFLLILNLIIILPTCIYLFHCVLFAFSARYRLRLLVSYAHLMSFKELKMIVSYFNHSDVFMMLLLLQNSDPITLSLVLQEINRSLSETGVFSV